MHRFYLPPTAWRSEPLQLDPAESHHALDVLRLERDDRVTVFDGRGEEMTASITNIAKGRIELRKITGQKSPPLRCQITLAQAVPKGKNMDLIVEKATELGAATIQPLISERTVVQYDAAEAPKKAEKWQRVAIEATKQCGQNWLPEVGTPLTPKAFFHSLPRYDLLLIASLQPGARPLKAVLRDHGTAPTAKVLILVGPEGDFTPAEISLALSHGCQPITLGPIILRTETAALYCLSILSHELLNPAA
jgi:16S rRNA (uracil1498-N3)-methyltransferase